MEQTRDKWLIQMSPCKASLEAYQDLSIRTAAAMRGASRECELYDHCPMVKAERKARKRSSSNNRDSVQLMYSGTVRNDRILAKERKRLLDELRGKKDGPRSAICIRKVAQRLAEEIVLINIRSMGMTFEQAVSDAIVSNARIYRRRKFKVFNGNSWVEITGIDNVMDDIARFAMLIIGANGSQP